MALHFWAVINGELDMLLHNLEEQQIVFHLQSWLQKKAFCVAEDKNLELCTACFPALGSKGGPHKQHLPERVHCILIS